MDNQSTSIRPRSGKILAGLILIAAGVVLLLHQIGYVFPSWLISPPMAFVILSLVIGAKKQFKNPSWILPFLIAGAFVLDRAYPVIDISRYIIPAVIIGLGLFVMFGRSHQWKSKRWNGPHWQWEENPPVWNNPVVNISAAAEDGEFVEAVSVFGGAKKTVLSKNFTGGDIVTFIGGAEINLAQADIQGRVVLEVTQILGGTKLIVPPHWDVISEISAIFGGIEDKRRQPASALEPGKILVLRGTSVLGGIEIQSFV